VVQEFGLSQYNQKVQLLIHQKDLAPLSPRNYFRQAPVITLDTYRAIWEKCKQIMLRGESPHPGSSQLVTKWHLLRIKRCLCFNAYKKQRM